MAPTLIRLAHGHQGRRYNRILQLDGCTVMHFYLQRDSKTELNYYYYYKEKAHSSPLLGLICKDNICHWDKFRWDADFSFSNPTFAGLSDTEINPECWAASSNIHFISTFNSSITFANEQCETPACNLLPTSYSAWGSVSYCLHINNKYVIDSSMFVFNLICF